MAQGKSSSRLERFGRKLGQRSRSLLQLANRSTHHRFIALGVMLLLCFLPTWLRVIGQSLLNGSSNVLLNLGFAYLGGDILWRQRQQLVDHPPTPEERILGYLLIVGGGVCLPLVLASASLQALVAAVILLGIVIALGGISVVQKHPLAIALILISLYPDLGYLGNAIRRALTGKQLEATMAWMAGSLFALVGHPVAVDGIILSLSPTIESSKAVEVASGCSGFDLAFPIAGFSLIMGMYFKQPWKKTFTLMAIGVALALAFNVPRIMLLAVAVVYWGKDSFEFWHGPIGGQIFSMIMLTAFYYIAMAMIEQKPKKIRSK